MLQKFLDHKQVYFWFLVLIAIALSISKFLMSVGIIALLANWLIEGDFAEKWRTLKTRKALWLILSVYVLHIIGLLWSSDYQYGFGDLQKKLPLFILPLVIGTSSSLSAKQIRLILWCFTTTIIVSSFISIAAFFGIFTEKLTDPREMSLYISHIRLALLLNVSVYFSGYYLFFQSPQLKKYEKVVFSIGVIWLIPFLFFLRSFTGIILFGILLFFIIIYWAWLQKNIIIKILVPLGIIAVLFAGACFISHSVTDFKKVNTCDYSKLEERTSKGNRYYHDTCNTQIENGNYIWLYICEKELSEEWNKKSILPYDGKDRKGHYLRNTLIRYVTSRGFRKDAEGIAQLTQKDIELVEMGYANHIYQKKFSIQPKIYELIWQIDVYMKGGNPSGHSVTQRIEYLKAAKYIISNNFWGGVGTGDVQLEFNKYYEITNSKLSTKWRRRAHNQYITFLLTFGVFGFIWLMIAFFLPPLIEKKYHHFFFLLFILIIAISMLNEDTLENHAGICFFSFFYSLFVFADNNGGKIT